MEKEMINRLKIVLAEEQKSSKWLAEQLGKDSLCALRWRSGKWKTICGLERAGVLR